MAKTLGRFGFGKLAKYPHMKPADTEIWERFIDAHPWYFERVEYDVHIGEGADFLPTNTDTPDGRQNRLYQRKIDVVAYKEGVTTLIELKPVADTATLGQILAYKDLYTKTKKHHQNPKILVICGKIMNEMKDIYSKQKIEVMIV